MRTLNRLMIHWDTAEQKTRTACHRTDLPHKGQDQVPFFTTSGGALQNNTWVPRTTAQLRWTIWPQSWEGDAQPLLQDLLSRQPVTVSHCVGTEPLLCSVKGHSLWYGNRKLPGEQILKSSAPFDSMLLSLAAHFHTPLSSYFMNIWTWLFLVTAVHVSEHSKVGDTHHVKLETIMFLH